MAYLAQIGLNIIYNLLLIVYMIKIKYMKSTNRLANLTKKSVQLINNLKNKISANADFPKHITSFQS